VDQLAFHFRQLCLAFFDQLCKHVFADTLPNIATQLFQSKKFAPTITAKFSFV
jgi:hypothetical protein